MIRLRSRAAVILAATIIGTAGGLGTAWALSTVNVPNAGGQLTGTVYICVNSANEGQQYVELGHPAPGNCAAGYLQYAANQPDNDTTPAGPAVLVNSETFAATSATGETLKVSLPAGAHISGTPSAVDLDASAAAPDVVTVKTVDNVTGQVTVAYSAGTAGHAIQVTYDYAS